jgi:hypothetical protein
MRILAHPELRNRTYLSDQDIDNIASDLLKRRDFIHGCYLTLEEAINSGGYAVYFGYTKRGSIEYCGFLTNRGLKGTKIRQTPVLTNPDGSRLDLSKLRLEGK